MTEHVLVADDRYGGNYVALRSFGDSEVIASGANPTDVLAAARARGVQNPVLFFVPKHGTTLVY